MPSTLVISNYRLFEEVQDEFPHIAKNLESMTGTALFNKYIMNVLMDTRSGTRQGFPTHIGAALVKLSEIHDYYYPEYALNFNLD